MKLEKTFNLCWGRLRDDGGHVGVLMAMFIFVMIGSLVMTWNTAQLSKEKMRLQAAADSAALSYCIWQARGMNAVQNLNDEIYLTLDTANGLYKFSLPIQLAGAIVWQGRVIPIIGPIMRACAIAMHIVSGIPGALSGWLAKRLCPYVIRPTQFFYATASPALGLWGAQQLAARNGADELQGDAGFYPLLTKLYGNESFTNFISKIQDGDWSRDKLGDFGLYAVGAPAMGEEFFKLPLENGVPRIIDGDIGKYDNVWDFAKASVGKVLDARAYMGDPWSSFKVSRWLNNTNVPKILVSILGAAEGVFVKKLYQSYACTAFSAVHKVFGSGETWAHPPMLSPPWDLKDTSRAEPKDRKLPKPVAFVARRSAGRIETMTLEAWTQEKEAGPVRQLDMLAVAAAQCVTGDVTERSPYVSENENVQRPFGFGTGATAKLIPVRDYVEAIGTAEGNTALKKLEKGIFH